MLPPFPENMLKLFYAAASPFVRKCLVAAIELGLRDRIELVPAAAHPVNRDANVVARNPLGKIPTLITDEGLALYDSRVICEYLSSLGDGSLIPRNATERLRVLTQQSLADGVMDAAVLTSLRDVRPARSVALERLDHGPAREGDLGPRCARRRGGGLRRPRRPGHDRVRLCARLSRLSFRDAWLAGHAPQHRRVVRVVSRTRLDDRHATRLSSPPLERGRVSRHPMGMNERRTPSCR